MALLIAVFVPRAAVAGVDTSACAGDDVAAPGSIKLKPGPWGNLEYYPITIAAPEELLKVRGIEDGLVKWVFGGYSKESFEKLLDELQVSAADKGEMLASVSVNEEEGSLTLTPMRESVMKLSPRELQGLYRAMGPASENESEKWEFLAKKLETFQQLGVSKRTLDLLKKLSASNGRFLVCYCMPYVFAGIGNYPEKVALSRALSEQQTMLLKLRISSTTDINALGAYWGKAFWTTDVKAILESIKRLPGGGVLDVIELLPPLPTSHLYNYPVPPNVMAGPMINKNCTWTAFNFFRDPPDSGYSNPVYVAEKLKTNFYLVQSDPRYGDVAIFLTPNKELVHAAVYIADDVVYTKNGDNLWHPWVFSKISDLKESFSYSVPPGQALSVYYFRNKYY